MQTQHDTKLLESVVQSISEKLAAPARQLEQASARLTKEADASAQAQVAVATAQSKRRILLAEGTKIMLVMIAVAIVIVALGLAARMVMTANPFITAQPAEISVAENPRPIVPQIDQNEKTVDGGVITTDFSVFRHTKVMLAGAEYKVTAGHEFAHEKDQTFTHAWCYSNVFVDGLSLDINLGTLEPGSAPKQAFVPPETLAKAGVSSADVNKLFRNCPWLEGNPNQSSAVDSSNVFTFSGDVDKSSVDEMIRAVSTGANVVEFSSPGGLIHEAIRGYDALKRAGVRTIATGECASACTLLFLGGSEREVATGGSIAVHQWRTENGQTYDADAQLTSALLVNLVADAGVSEQFYVAGATTPANTLYTLSRMELTQWGVVTKQS